MKKTLFLITTVMLVLMAFVSCGLTIGEDGTTKSLATISFSDKGTRALSASINGSSVANIYWRYSAVKTDGGPAAGSTSSSAVTSPSKTTTKVVKGTADAPAAGLDGTISGFSVGEWTFNLYGYISADDCKKANEYYAFSGSVTGEKLSVGTVKTVKVNVSPDKAVSDSAKGKLVFSDIELIPGGTDDTWTYSLDGGTTNESMTSDITDNVFNKTFEDQAAGTYNIVITGTYGITPNQTTRTAKVKVAVYRGLTTTITGSVDDLQTGLEFSVEDDATDFYMLNYDPNTVEYTGNLPESEMLKAGSKVTTAAEVIARDKRVFVGWNTSKNGGEATRYAASKADAFELNANTTLYAEWGCEVTYDANDADDATKTVPAKAVCKEGDEITLPSRPSDLVKDGFVFAGWSTDKTGAGTIYKAESKLKITENLKLYAIFREFGVVTYNGNGGKTSDDKSETTVEATKANSYKTTLINTGFTKVRDDDNDGTPDTTKGYAIAGWNTKADGSGTNYVPGVEITLTEDITLYAVWQGWVQLSAKTAKFAEFNIGSTINDYALVTTADYSTTAILGGLYGWGGINNARDLLEAPDYYSGPHLKLPVEKDNANRLWGSNWILPTENQYDVFLKTYTTGSEDNTAFNDELNREDFDGVNKKYLGTCVVPGILVSGKSGTDYENSKVFFPDTSFFSSTSLTIKEPTDQYYDIPYMTSNGVNTGSTPYIYYQGQNFKKYSKHIPSKIVMQITSGVAVRAILAE